jgi:hypothetical protein
MEMWFRAIQMHADLARGGNGFTILGNQSTQTPPKNRLKKQNSLFDQLDRATKALTELERRVDSHVDHGPIIEPDIASYDCEQREVTRYHHHEDEIKEDPGSGHAQSLFFQPPSRPAPQDQRPSQARQKFHHEDSLEDSTESLESIVPVPVRKPATQHRQSQTGTFSGVKERQDEDLSARSGGSGGSGGGSAWT